MSLIGRHIEAFSCLARQAPVDCWSFVFQTPWLSLVTPGTGSGSASPGSETPSQPRQVVFLLHGICRSRIDMALMAGSLRSEGFEVVNWRYPSTRLSMDKLADKLAEALEPYRDCSVSFVTHSMGGIVVRTCLARHPITNVSRLVMIGTPNQGAFLADMFGDWMPYRLALGPAGQQLRQGEAGACLNAGIPACEFGIIAGGTGRPHGMNSLIPGDNDGTVSVESTRLDGMKDFALLPYGHAYIQMMPRTVKNTVHFLRTGQFADGRGMRAGASAAPAPYSQ